MEMIDIGCNIPDAALLRSLAEDVPDMALSIRERLRDLAGRLEAREALPGYEKMRGGKPVAFWRDDALEAAAKIVERYQADQQIVVDIRRMKSTSGVRDQDGG
jgi:hypothetical protein